MFYMYIVLFVAALHRSGNSSSDVGSGAGGVVVPSLAGSSSGAVGGPAAAAAVDEDSESGRGASLPQSPVSLHDDDAEHAGGHSAGHGGHGHSSSVFKPVARHGSGSVHPLPRPTPPQSPHRSRDRSYYFDVDKPLHLLNVCSRFYSEIM